MINGIKAVCATEVGENNQGTPAWITRYNLTAGIQLSSGIHNNGGVITSIFDVTESVFNLLIQQAIADEINLQTSNIAEATAEDVFGGRI